MLVIAPPKDGVIKAFVHTLGISCISVKHKLCEDSGAPAHHHDQEMRMPTGPGDVLELIRHGRVTTRGDVLDVTGLSRMTVAQRVDALLAAGLVIEGAATAATGGRRPRSLSFNGEHGVVLAAAVDTTHARVAVTDLNGRILARDVLDVAIEKGPEQTLDAIVSAIQQLRARADVPLSRVRGVGLSLTGPIDPLSGRPSEPPIMPGWDAYPIADHLSPDFPGIAVLTANDADAAALGEYTAGFPDTRALCLVKVGTGIGTGIVIDGIPYSGIDGGAGDIGHVRLRDESEAVCQCGAVGCLAAVASGRAVARRLAALGHEARSGRDVGELLAKGDPDAANMTQEAGRLIGEVMATVVCVLNPEVVVVSGALTSAPLLAGMRETLYRLSMPRATRHLALQAGMLGEDAALVGLTRMVVDREYSAAAVNAWLLG
jgi:predicted NBD/HSP70 family sugar kinase